MPAKLRRRRIAQEPHVGVHGASDHFHDTAATPRATLRRMLPGCKALRERAASVIENVLVAPAPLEPTGEAFQRSAKRVQREHETTHIPGHSDIVRRLQGKG